MNRESGPTKQIRAEADHAKYGLPVEVKFCRVCVLSNQRPSTTVEFVHKTDTKKETVPFDDAGICDACTVSRRKNEEVDWEERERELNDLCNKFRTNGAKYDCLVPGSGGKDSFYAAHILKYKYGMTPLTVTWSPHIYTEWGWNNFRAWIDAGFDNYLMTPNGLTHRLLTRLAVENLFHPFQPFIFGQKALAPKMAARFNIPLVFYGESEAEYGNPLQQTESPIRDEKYFSAVDLANDRGNIYLGGTAVCDLENVYGISRADLEPYLPIRREILERSQIEVRFLGYYLKWHPQGSYYYAVENGGFQPSPERTPGTYSKYNSIDDKIDDLHYYTTFIKFGIGRATYDAAQEIRNGEITRDEGIGLVKKYDGEFPERFIEEIFQYLSIDQLRFPVAHRMFDQPNITRDYFNDLTDSFRSPHLWEHDSGSWKLRHVIWQEK